MVAWKEILAPAFAANTTVTIGEIYSERRKNDRRVKITYHGANGLRLTEADLVWIGKALEDAGIDYQHLRFHTSYGASGPYYHAGYTSDRNITFLVEK